MSNDYNFTHDIFEDLYTNPECALESILSHNPYLAKYHYQLPKQLYHDIESGKLFNEFENMIQHDICNYTEEIVIEHIKTYNRLLQYFPSESYFLHSSPIFDLVLYRVNGSSLDTITCLHKNSDEKKVSDFVNAEIGIGLDVKRVFFYKEDNALYVDVPVNNVQLYYDELSKISRLPSNENECFYGLVFPNGNIYVLRLDDDIYNCKIENNKAHINFLKFRRLAKIMCVEEFEIYLSKKYRNKYKDISLLNILTWKYQFFIRDIYDYSICVSLSYMLKEKNAYKKSDWSLFIKKEDFDDLYHKCLVINEWINRQKHNQLDAYRKLYNKTLDESKCNNFNVKIVFNQFTGKYKAKYSKYEFKKIANSYINLEDVMYTFALGCNNDNNVNSYCFQGNRCKNTNCAHHDKCINDDKNNLNMIHYIKCIDDMYAINREYVYKMPKEYDELNSKDWNRYSSTLL